MLTHTDKCVIGIILHIVEWLTRGKKKKIRDALSWLRQSNVIAIAPLVSEIWLTIERCMHARTHTYTHGLSFFCKVCKVVNFAAQWHTEWYSFCLQCPFQSELQLGWPQHVLTSSRHQYIATSVTHIPDVSLLLLVPWQGVRDTYFFLGNKVPKLIAIHTLSFKVPFI